jgi:hypothetical protein
MKAIFGPLVIVALLVAVWAIFVRGNPGGISDARYAQFSRLGAPKLLYSCTRKPTSDAVTRKARECGKNGRSGCDQEAYDWREASTETTVEFASAAGQSTYDELLMDAKRNCAATNGSMGGGEMKVLEAVKN